MRFTVKGAFFCSAMLAAAFTLVSVLVNLPAPPAPTVGSYSASGLEVYPEVQVIRMGHSQADAQTVDRTHKGNLLRRTDAARFNRYRQFKDWSSAPGQPWNVTYNIG